MVQAKQRGLAVVIRKTHELQAGASTVYFIIPVVQERHLDHREIILQMIYLAKQVSRHGMWISEIVRLFNLCIDPFQGAFLSTLFSALQHFANDQDWIKSTFFTNFSP